METEKGEQSAAKPTETQATTPEGARTPSAELRNFSKRASMSERSQLAQEIWAQRVNARTEMASIQKEILTLNTELVGHKEVSERINQEIVELEQKLEVQKQGAIKRLLNLLHNRELTRLIWNKQEQASELAGLLQEKQSLKQRLEQVVATGQELINIREQAREKVRTFYAEQAQQFETSQALHDVSQICREHNGVIIHGMTHNMDAMSTPIGGPAIGHMRSVDFGDQSFSTKLKVFLALQPATSTSIITPEVDPQNRFWAPAGVLLKSGRVETASANDAYSGPESVSTRVTANSAPKTDAEFKAGLDRAVESRKAYNELVTSHPEIAGLYLEFPLGESSIGSEGRPTDDEVYRLAEEYKVPVFGIANGLTHEATFNAETRQYELGSVRSVEDILNNAPPITAETRTTLVESVMREIPFKFKTTAVERLADVANTRDLYTTLRISENYSRWNEQPSGSTLATVPTIGGMKEYFLAEEYGLGKFVAMRYTRLDGQQVEIKENVPEPVMISERLTTTGETEAVEINSVVDLRDLLLSEYSLLQLSQQDKPLSQEYLAKLTTVILRLLACRDQAKAMGDTEIADSIEQRLTETKDNTLLRQCQEFITSRTDRQEQNAFRLRREDID